MNDRWTRLYRRALLACLGGMFLFSSGAQIAFDGSTGPAQALAGPDYRIGAELGQTAGPNLFHSFSEFNLAPGQSATFSGPPEIRTVLSRVTGGSVSQLNGRLASTIPGADFYFLNPSGVVIGPEAVIDVGGSFSVSTAAYLKLGEGGRFDAVQPGRSVLTTAPVAAFGFLGGTAGGIRVEGATITSAARRDLALAGGVIEIDGADLRTEGGRIDLRATTGPAELAVPLSPGPTRSGGEVRIQNGSRLEATDGGGIQVRAGAVEIESHSMVRTSASDGVTAGKVEIEAEALLLTGGAEISSVTTGSARGGDVEVSAAKLTLVGEGIYDPKQKAAEFTDYYLDPTAIRTASFAESGGGDGGELSINAGSIEISEGARISAEGFGSGSTGKLEVKAETIQVRQGSTAFSGIYSINPNSAASGKTGDVSLETGLLTALGDKNGARVLIGSHSFAGGEAGNVSVRARDVEMNGNGWRSFIAASNLNPAGSGDGGTVVIEAKNLRLIDGGFVLASTWGKGAAGDIYVTAETMLLDGGDRGAAISSSSENGRQSGFPPFGGDGQGGQSGGIFVEAGTIEMRGGNRANNVGVAIITASYSTGDAGTVQVKARRISMDAEESPTITGISALTFPVSSGKAGDVEVIAEEIDIVGGAGASAGITSTALGTGEGGNIKVTAQSLSIRSRDNQPGPFGVVGISAGTLNPTSQAKAGSVHVEAGRLVVSDYSIISARTLGSGAGGTVDVQAGTVLLQNQASIESQSFGSGASGRVTVQTSGPLELREQSEISTRAAANRANGILIRSDAPITLWNSAVTSQASLDGGELRLESADRIHLAGSRISSDAGQDGGNIFLEAGLVTLNVSELNANALRAQAGNIRITTDSFLASSDSRVTASSEFGVAGEITILGPAIDLSASLAPLTRRLLGAEAQLPEHCAVKLPGDLSSFLVGGAGGSPPQPDGWQPSFISPFELEGE